MDMRFGTWNVRSLYRAGVLGLVTSEIYKYRMDLVGVQEVRWEGSGILESGNYTLFYANHQLGTAMGTWRYPLAKSSAVKYIGLPILSKISCILGKG